jgi:hypothetical protein
MKFSSEALRAASWERVKPKRLLTSPRPALAFILLPGTPAQVYSCRIIYRFAALSLIETVWGGL